MRFESLKISLVVVGEMLARSACSSVLLARDLSAFIPQVAPNFLNGPSDVQALRLWQGHAGILEGSMLIVDGWSEQQNDRVIDFNQVGRMRACVGACGIATVKAVHWSVPNYSTLRWDRPGAIQDILLEGVPSPSSSSLAVYKTSTYLACAFLRQPLNSSTTSTP
ncbi:hypothetical protein BDZ45DRAFT_741445 [Acephala macrosclerotiorum]|nr:hypothetical protein BDZ45DRAFT_741445 [Acephala macrosclerotiorum]